MGYRKRFTCGIKDIYIWAKLYFGIWCIQAIFVWDMGYGLEKLWDMGTPGIPPPLIPLIQHGAGGDIDTI